MEVRIGIFLCDCGGSLTNIDFPRMKGNLEKLENVAFVDISRNLCLEEGKKGIISKIRGENIDRVVIGACSPELCEHNFIGTLEESGINANLLSMANIREQCSWAHEGDATGKALKLVNMAVNKARLLQPVEMKKVPISKEVLVIGGGFSGLKSALELSRVGLRAAVVERESTLEENCGSSEAFTGSRQAPKRLSAQ